MRGDQPVWSALGRFQVQGYGVDAPALVGGHLVTLAFEHVTEVGLAVGAADLDPPHAERIILHIKNTIGITARVRVVAPDTLERSLGKAKRVYDRRPKG